MISRAYKFIFVHCPKTAGNSIQSVLAEYCLGDWYETDHPIDNSLTTGNYELKDFFGKKHCPISAYRIMWDQEQFGHWDSYFKFTCVRNPWDRAISHYFYHNKEWDRKRFIDKMHKCYSQSSMISLNGEPHLDYILRYEHLDESWEKLCSILNIDYVKLPTLNKSTHKHYSEYYDDELIELVSERYADDIKLFRYSFMEQI
jgi:hypothetical protein